VAHASGLQAAPRLSRHRATRDCSPMGRNSKIAASAEAMIGRESKTVNEVLVLSPLSTA
jgi:hypothetical protein